MKTEEGTCLLWAPGVGCDTPTLLPSPVEQGQSELEPLPCTEHEDFTLLTLLSPGLLCEQHQHNPAGAQTAQRGV